MRTGVRAAALAILVLSGAAVSLTVVWDIGKIAASGSAGWGEAGPPVSYYETISAVRERLVHVPDGAEEEHSDLDQRSILRFVAVTLDPEASVLVGRFEVELSESAVSTVLETVAPQLCATTTPVQPFRLIIADVEADSVVELPARSLLCRAPHEPSVRTPELHLPAYGFFDGFPFDRYQVDTLVDLNPPGSESYLPVVMELEAAPTLGSLIMQPRYAPLTLDYARFDIGVRRSWLDRSLIMAVVLLPLVFLAARAAAGRRPQETARRSTPRSLSRRGRRHTIAGRRRVASDVDAPQQQAGLPTFETGLGVLAILSLRELIIPANITSLTLADHLLLLILICLVAAHVVPALRLP